MKNMKKKTRLVRSEHIVYIVTSSAKDRSAKARDDIEDVVSECPTIKDMQVSRVGSTKTRVEFSQTCLLFRGGLSPTGKESLGIKTWLLSGPEGEPESAYSVSDQ
jgi:hypothetical protein